MTLFQLIVDDDDKDEDFDENLVRVMAEQDDDIAEALAYLQDMQNSNHRVARIQWHFFLKELIKNAFRLLKENINKIPLVRKLGTALFC